MKTKKPWKFPPTVRMNYIFESIKTWKVELFS